MGRARRAMAWVPWRQVFIVGAGALFYFLLGKIIHLPVLFGLRLEFQYAVLGLFSVVYGPFVGFAVGAVGEIALGAAGGGVWWSVVAAAALAGFGLGLLCHGRYRREGGFFGGTLAAYILAGALVQAVAFVVVCPALDILFYSESLDNILRRGLLTALANALVTVVAGGLPLAVLGGLLPWQRLPARAPAAHNDYSG